MCFHERKTPAKIVTCVSGIVVMCGIVMLVNTIVFAAGTSESLMDADLGDVTETAKKFRNGSLATLLVFSIVAILTGLAGTLCLCKGPWSSGHIGWPIGYGIVLFFVWVVTLVMGSIVLAVSTTSSNSIHEFCEQQKIVDQDYDWIRGQIETIDRTLNAYSSTYMCS
jgi:hypothetical protein